MKFDYIIGNPPYQETTDSESTRMPPVYDQFMEAAFLIGDKVELITPARFLFNTGFTSKKWNNKMLNDVHFKILSYEPESDRVFPGKTITGGLAISYRDSNNDYGSIETFTKFAELNDILKKVSDKTNRYMDSVVFPSLNYGLTEIMKAENPDLLDRLRTSAFVNLAPIFFEECPEDNVYISMIGLFDGKRVTRYVRRDYIKDSNRILDKYNLLLSEANGAAGQLGTPVPARIIGVADILKPGEAYTQTFIAVGAFDTLEEAYSAKKYLKTKFARAMIGVKKATQHTPRPVWTKVPLQIFSNNSDIDWSQTIEDIDKQLYKKYGLNQKEIEFIETHVKELE